MSLQDRPSFEFGPFRLDLSEHRLLRDGRPLPLSPKVFDVLRVLVQNAGRLVEKDDLVREVWPDSFVEEGAVARAVSVLRRALDESASGQQYIETVPKRGYRFVASVTPVSPEPVGETRMDSAVDVQTPPARVQPMSDTALRRSARRAFLAPAAAVAAVLLTVGALVFSSLRPRATPALSAPAPTHRQVTITGREGAPTISPDGRRIAYVSNDAAGKTRVMIQELAGGPPLAVFNAPEAGHLRWSPDGSELIVWARGSGQNGIYVIPQLGGTPRRIVDGLYIACWSPDGSTIAVPSYIGGTIWLFDKLGQQQRTIALQGVHWSIWDIDWSAANGLLTVVSNDYERRYTIWTVRPDGSDQRNVLTENTEIPSVRWAPRGDAIYYLRRANQTSALFRVSVPPGDDPREAASTPLITGLEIDRSFALSADGQRLVYARAPFYSNLWMLEADGRDAGEHTEAKELTRGTSLIERPRVSPDGTSVVFNIGHEPLTNLYTMPLTGGPPKQLTFFDAFTLGGVWSGDASRIAFASTEGGTPRVWIVNASGGVPRALVTRDLSDTFDLTWSPGSRILYQQAGNQDYYELDPDTGEGRPLVRNSSVGWIFSPVYSPDGRKIAVRWNRPPNSGIWIIDALDRSETLVYKTPRTSPMPIGWSADGRAVYAVEGGPGTSRGATAPIGETMSGARILEVPLDGGDVRTIATLPFQEIGSVAMTPDARTFVYTVYSSRSDVWVVDNFDVAPERAIAREE